MLLFRTVNYCWRWAMFAKKCSRWGIDAGRNIEELKANLENSVLRYEAAEFHRESDALREEWQRLFQWRKR